MFANNPSPLQPETVERYAAESTGADLGSSTLDLACFVQQVAAEVIASSSRPSAATLHFVGEIGCRVDSNCATLLGRVVAELVNNALEYAHPTGIHGKIAIRCQRLSAGYLIVVADDGIGLPEGFDPMREGAGLRLVRLLVEQLGGSISFESHGLGLACRVCMPRLALAGKPPLAPLLSGGAT